MELFLHIGIGKTATSIIQEHIYTNRDWLKGRGIYIAETGFSDHPGIPVGPGLAGYVGCQKKLFWDMSRRNRAKFLKELRSAERKGFHKCLLSWEGLSKFRKDKVQALREFCRGHEPRIIVYLRDQRSLVQSSYLQTVKDGAPRASLAEMMNTRDLFFIPRYRDYEYLLDLWASVFGNDSLIPRIYDRKRLLRGDIVDDFFSIAGIDTQENGFINKREKSNISLDAAAAACLEFLEHYFRNFDRSAIVDLFLAYLSVNPPRHKYFLSREQVRTIRDHYAASNRRVSEKYFGNTLLFDDDDDGNYCLKETGTEEALSFVHLLEFMNAYRTYPTWLSGETVRGQAIGERICLYRGWWRKSEQQGIWSNGGSSVIRFRVNRQCRRKHNRVLCVTFGGEYYGKNDSSRVSVNGSDHGRIDLRSASVEVPIGELGPYSEIEMIISHQHPESAPQGGARKIAYRLQSLAYGTR